MADKPDKPFPGLRAFLPEESNIFFGREASVDQMVDLLAEHHFLAVTGTSGSGKSSLVFVGLQNALELGVLSSGADWLVVTMRPGRQPLRALAAALTQAHVTPSAPNDEFALLALLQRGPLALLQWLKSVGFSAKRNLLLVVDQFEELFRNRATDVESSSAQLAWREEAEAFVSLLLATPDAPDRNVYIVITMRSDFLGDCATFSGLPEAINRSQFLTPRLTRDETRLAIEGPIAIFDGSIEPTLVTRLLNEMGNDPDQLPLMQHALMRLWKDASASDDGKKKHLSLKSFEDNLHNLKRALSDHAEEVLREFKQQEDSRLVRILFQALTEGGGGRNDRRRTARLKDVADIAGVAPEKLIPIVDAFSKPGRHFLRLTGGLGPETMVDIMHESLIRQWGTLQQWVHDEFLASDLFKRLERRARDFGAGNDALLDGFELQRALNWLKQDFATKKWAARYAAGEQSFQTVVDFIDASKKAGRNRRLLGAATLVTSAAVLALSLYLPYVQYGTYEERFKSSKGTADSIAALIDLRLRNDLRAVGRPPRGIESASPMTVVLRSFFTPNLGQEELLKFWPWLRGGVLNALRLGADNLGYRFGLVDAFQEARAAERLLTVMYGHTEPLLGTAFSADGRLVASLSVDRTARIWDSETGREVQQFPLPLQIDPLNPGSGMVEFAPDNRLVAVAQSSPVMSNGLPGEPSQEIRAVVKDLQSADSGATGTPLEIAASTPLLAMKFSADGNSILGAFADGKLTTWDARTGRQLSQRALSEVTEQIVHAVFSPNGNQLLVKTSSELRAFDATSLAQSFVLKEIETPPVNSHPIVYSPNGSWISVVLRERTQIVSAQDGKMLTVIQNRAPLLDAAVANDGQTVVTVPFDGTARMVHAGTSVEVAKLSNFALQIGSIRLSPDGSHILTGAADGKLGIWDAEAIAQPDGSVISGGEVRNEMIACGLSYAWFSDDSRRIVDVSSTGAVAIHDAANLRAFESTGQSQSSNCPQPSVDASYSPAQERLAVLVLPGDGPQLWDTTGATPRLIQKLRLDETNTRISFAFSPTDPLLVAAVGGRELHAWSSNDGAASSIAFDVTGVVALGSPAFSSDGNYLVAAVSTSQPTTDNPFPQPDKVFLWEVSTGRKVREALVPSDSFFFWWVRPEAAEQFVIGDGRGFALWDATNGERRDLVLNLQDRSALPPLAVTVSRDRKRAILVPHFGVPRLADLSTGYVLGTLGGQSGALQATFSRDRRRALVITGEGGALVWNVDAPDLEAQLKWAIAAEFEPIPPDYAQDLRLAEATPPIAAAADGRSAALAACAKRLEDEGANEQDPARRQEKWLEALELYTRAIEGAAPADRGWRYRRASLARVLARQGWMDRVAAALADTASPSCS